MKYLALIVAVVCFVLAILYWTGSGMLPQIALDGQHHVKHGILFALLGVFALIWMRFAAGAARAA